MDDEERKPDITFGIVSMPFLHISNMPEFVKEIIVSQVAAMVQNSNDMVATYVRTLCHEAGIGYAPFTQEEIQERLKEMMPIVTETNAQYGVVVKKRGEDGEFTRDPEDERRFSANIHAAVGHGGVREDDSSSDTPRKKTIN